MTESEAKSADEKWSKYNEQNRILGVLQGFNINEKDFLKELKGFFAEKPLTETYHNILRKIAENHKDFHYRQMAHRQIALELNKANEDFQSHLVEGAKYELLRYKRQGVQKVKISA